MNSSIEMDELTEWINERIKTNGRIFLSEIYEKIFEIGERGES